MSRSRRLVLMRHAKSSWKEAGPDHGRPLNGRGRRDAPRIAERLASLGWAPDRVVSSDARRTRETWRRMIPVLGECPAEFTPQLYLAGLGAIRELAREWPDDEGPVLVLGHNPGWEEAVGRLSGEAVRFTTANAALLRGEGSSWSEALEGPWMLDALLRPREL